MAVSPAALTATRLILALTSGCSQGWKGLRLPSYKRRPWVPGGGPNGWQCPPPRQAEQLSLAGPPDTPTLPTPPTGSFCSRQDSPKHPHPQPDSQALQGLGRPLSG